MMTDEQEDDAMEESHHNSTGYCINGCHTTEDEVMRIQCKRALSRMVSLSSFFKEADQNIVYSDGSQNNSGTGSFQTEGMNFMLSIDCDDICAVYQHIGYQ